MKEVVLQELDNFREPMGGWDQDTDDDEVVVTPTETATRANVPVTTHTLSTHATDLAHLHSAQRRERFGDG